MVAWLWIELSTKHIAYVINSQLTFCFIIQGLLKVYTDAIRVDTEYKTVFANNATTAAEVVDKILSKFRIGYKDPRLYYLTMEIRTKTDCKPYDWMLSIDLFLRLYPTVICNSVKEVGTVLVLDPTSRPLALQNCHPIGMSRFSIKISPGYPVRIYDYCVSPQVHTYGTQFTWIKRQLSGRDLYLIKIQQ